MSEVDEILEMASRHGQAVQKDHAVIAMQVVADLQSVHGLNPIESNRAYEAIVGLLDQGRYELLEAYMEGFEQ